MQTSQLITVALLTAAGLGVIVAATTDGSGNTDSADPQRSGGFGQRVSDARERFGDGVVGSSRIRNERSVFASSERRGGVLPIGLSPRESGPARTRQTVRSAGPPRTFVPDPVLPTDEPDPATALRGVQQNANASAPAMTPEERARRREEIAEQRAEARRLANERNRDLQNRAAQEDLRDLRPPPITDLGSGIAPDGLAEAPANEPANPNDGFDLPPGFEDLPPVLQDLLRQLLQQFEQQQQNGANGGGTTGGGGGGGRTPTNPNTGSGDTPTPDRPSTGGGGAGGGGSPPVTDGNPQPQPAPLPTVDGAIPAPGPTVEESGVSASLRWVPVLPPACSAPPAGLGPVLDLYVRLDQPDTAVSFDARSPGLGIELTGGSVLQQARTDGEPDRVPSGFLVNLNPCVATDTFLDFTGDDGFIAFSAAFPAPGAASGSVSFETGSLPGAIGIQDPDYFGDDGYYVRIVRLALDDGVTAIGGAIRFGARDDATNEAQQLQLAVPDCPTCFGGDPTTPGDGDPGDGGGDPGNGGGDPGDGGGDPGDGGGDPGDGGGDPGDGGGDPGDGGGDPGDGGGDPGDGGGDPDPDPDPEPEGLVWVEVPRPSEPIVCQLTPGVVIDETNVTRDLYVRFNMPDDLRVVGFGVDSPGGVAFDGPTAIQTGGNTISSPGAIALFPCVGFDSFFDMGQDSDPAFIAQPNQSDWGPLAEAGYATFRSENQAQPRPDLFPGSGSFYARILRVTTPIETVVSGEVDVIVREFGTGDTIEFMFTIPPIGGE